MGSWLRLAAVFFVLSAKSLMGQELNLPQSPILTIDQERLFDQAGLSARLSEELERRRQELAEENRQIENDLVSEELELTEKRATMPDAEFRVLADAFDKKVQSLRAEQDTKARELQRLGDAERQAFLQRITPILAVILRERGGLVLLDRRSTILAADAIDITDVAIARIKQALQESPAPAEDPESAEDPASQP